MSLKMLFIERVAADHPRTAAIREKLGIESHIVDDAKAVYDFVSSADDPVQKGKETLYLTRNRGAFVRQCPGTRHYTCCDYMILHVGTFCTMDCSYCILQSYFHPPVLQYFINHEDMTAELDQCMKEKAFRRIGTGEFTDSMIWEMWTDLSATLVPKFAAQDHMALELKTKTTAIDALKTMDHRRKTIMAWSLNTEAVIAENERGTASLSARLKAASRCESWGYPIAFHFDPLVIYEGCETDYRQVVQQIFDHVSPDNIVWISIGSFRFMPSLKPMVQKRFPKSKLVYGEFISGMDDKMRYFKPLRIKLYREIYDAVHAYSPELTPYFCMEDDEVWQKSFGFVPSERGGLPHMLDQSVIRCCRLSS